MRTAARYQLLTNLLFGERGAYSTLETSAVLLFGGGAVKRALYWIAAGGLSFWLPPVLASAISGNTGSWVTLNVVSVLGLVALSAVYWAYRRTAPSWGWISAGVYILGPVSIFTAGAFSNGPSGSAISHGSSFVLILLCLFPPATLWLSVLNSTIFSVLGVSITLMFLTLYQVTKKARQGRSAISE